MSLISMHGAWLSFSDAPLLDNAELHIEDNERVCLVGRNGAGKSTLMKILNREQGLDDGRIIYEHVAGLDGLAHINDGALVVAVALVGAHELDELIGVGGAVGAADNDLVGVDILNGAVMGGQDADTGVGGGLVLHTGGDQRLLGDHQRHGLTLHVGAHQCTVAVVVLEERDAWP